MPPPIVKAMETIDASGLLKPLPTSSDGSQLSRR